MLVWFFSEAKKILLNKKIDTKVPYFQYFSMLQYFRFCTANFLRTENPLSMVMPGHQMKSQILIGG